MKIIYFIIIFFSFILNTNALTKEEVEKMFENKNEVNIYLNLDKDDLIIKSEILDIIKNKDRTLTFNILKDNINIYSYKFNGNKINDSYNNINLKLNLENDKDQIINKNINDIKLIYFDSIYKGYYPNGTILKIKNFTNNNYNIKLYVLNENKLKIVKNNIKLKDNYYEFNIEKGNTYILSNKNTNSNINILITIILRIVIIVELVIIYTILKNKNYIELPKLKNSVLTKEK